MRVVRPSKGGDPLMLGEEILEAAKHLLRLRLVNIDYNQCSWVSLGRRVE